MIHLAIAHTDQDLDWLHALPVPCTVRVYSSQLAGAQQLPEGCELVPLRERRGTAGLLLQHLLTLARDLAGLRATRHDWTVFAPADALSHAPALLELIAAHEAWGDIQVLSTQGLQPLPRRLVERDQRDWIGDLPVRPERYCMATLAPLGRPDPEAARLADLYLRRHGLEAGSNLLAHFLDLCGFASLAMQAESADMGVKAPGTVFAVRHDRLLDLLGAGDSPLHRLDALVRCDPLYRQMLEHAWLHLFGLPFIGLDALPRPHDEDALASTAMARVSAAIDALLQRAESAQPPRHGSGAARRPGRATSDFTPAHAVTPAPLPAQDDLFAATVIEPRLHGLHAH